MKCPRCDGSLKVLRSYPVAERVFQDRRCAACGTQRATVLQMAAAGESAYRLKQRAEREQPSNGDEGAS